MAPWLISESTQLALDLSLSSRMVYCCNAMDDVTGVESLTSSNRHKMTSPDIQKIPSRFRLDSSLSLSFYFLSLSLPLSLPLSLFLFLFFILSLTLSVSCWASSETPIQLIFTYICLSLIKATFSFFLSLYRPCGIGAHRPSKRQTFAFLSLGLQIFCESQHEVSKANQKQAKR